MLGQRRVVPENRPPGGSWYSSGRAFPHQPLVQGFQGHILRNISQLFEFMGELSHVLFLKRHMRKCVLMADSPDGEGFTERSSVLWNREDCVLLKERTCCFCRL